MTRRVLFVADETLLLEGLRRMLRSFQREWELHFARGGPDALDRMAENSFDVLVADAHLQSLPTTDLFTEVRRRYPLTVRIVLAGERDRSQVLALVSLAHRVLVLPCPADELRSAIRRALRGC